MSESSAGVIDESVLDSYRMLQEDGQPDVVTEFIDAFLGDLPTRLERIRDAVAAKEPRDIKSAAHALKGASAAVGAVRLTQACAELEVLGRGGQSAGSDELLTQIEAEAAQAREGLLPIRRP